MTARTPYPGLRPFKRDEADIFFGREEQTDELLRRLADPRFLAVVGPSGCGKSSLVRAGMIVALETGFMATAGPRWHFAVMRPGSHPIARLAVALLEESAWGAERTDLEENAAFLEATLSRGPLGLVEALREDPLPEGNNLLVVVDQFEEIFRFRRENDRDQADAFVALLLESAAQREVPIYVVITMRSDFIGDCALFGGLPEALNARQYLTPRLTREQRRAAIVGPGRVFGGDVEPELVNRVLNEMGTDPDQLPIMQHLLMRMWTRAELEVPRLAEGSMPGDGGTEEDTLAELPTRVLRLSDYEAVGGFNRALSEHANEALSLLGDEQKRIAEVLFRRLSERGTDRRDLRRPTRVSEVAAVARTTPDEVIDVVNLFRNPQHGFLVPAVPEDVYPNTVLDISHESLIRQWDQLNEWVQHEADSAKTYRFLEESARLWEAGRAALWGTPNLENALEWKEEESPTREWAERYGGNLELAMEFLDASERERAARSERLEADRERELQQARSLAEAQWERAEMQLRVNRLLRRLTRGLVFLVVTLIAIGVGLYFFYFREYSAYYNTFAKVRGVPQGIGKLKPRQVRSRSASLKIVSRGRKGPVLYMQAVNSRDEPTPFHDVRTYLDPDSDEPSLQRECWWEFVYDGRGRVTYEMAYNKHKELVWGLVYSPSLEGSEDVRKAHFIGPDGYPKSATTSAANFVEFRYSAKGYEEHRRYGDRRGRPLPGPDKAYGQKRQFDDRGLATLITSLGADGEPINDDVGNASLILKYDDLGNSVEAVALDLSGAVTTINSGWSKATWAYDANGNLTEAAFFDESQNPTLHKLGFHRYSTSYDDHGNLVEQAYWDFDGKAAVLAEGYHSQRMDFDDHGNPTRTAYVGPDGDPTITAWGYAIWTAEYDQEDQRVEEAFFDPGGEATLTADGYSSVTFDYDERGNRNRTSYFDVDRGPVTTNTGYARKIVEYDEHDNPTRDAYFGTNGQPVTIADGYSSLQREYDGDGKMVRLMYFGVDGELATSTDGYAGWHAEYDQSGNRVAYEFLGVDKAPVNGKEGYAEVRTDYDDLGNEIRVAYFGVDDEPATSSSGIAGWESQFDPVGNQVAAQFFGVDGKPVTHRDGYAGWSASFDRRGNEIETVFLDVNGNPTHTQSHDQEEPQLDRYARRTYVYDGQNKVTEEAYFGIYGKPVLVGGGYARAIHQYDVRGNQVESAYFGVYGEPAVLERGYHSVKRRYDDHGNPVEISFSYADGKPVHLPEGYARLVSRYDKFGKLIEQAVFDVDGEPTMLTDDKIHKSVRRYDERGRLLELAYFGVDGEPMEHAGRYYLSRYRYDDRGNLVETSYHDANGDLVDSAHGYALSKSEYDQRGRLLSTSFFDASSLPTASTEDYARITFAYDERGKVNKIAIFGADGRRMSGKERYWKTSLDYDSQGNVIHQVYFDVSDRPVTINGGYASYRAKFDPHGNQIELTYFDANGKPVMCDDGYFRLVQKYNTRGQLVQTTTYDTRGRLAMNELLFARSTQEYDNRGNLLEIAAFNASDRPTTAHHDYHRMTYKYDERGNQIEEAYFGTNGEPVTLDGTFARWTQKHDDQGNVIEETYFGVDDRRVVTYDGFASVVRKFDDRGRILEERYFGADNEPVQTAYYGQHMTRFAYDQRGNKTEERYFGVEGEPTWGYVESGENCAWWTAAYDAAGDPVKSTCHQELPRQTR